MKISRDQLEQKILDFMAIVHECYANTNYSNDRSVYARDITEAAGWIAELRSGVDAGDVVDKILNPATAKHFGDYWRQGNWGDREAEAFEKLKAAITN